MGEDGQGTRGFGMEVFAELREGLGFQVGRHDLQQRRADQRQIRQQRGVATAAAVLAHQGVPPPVIPVLHAGPVATDQPQPLTGWCITPPARNPLNLHTEEIMSAGEL